MDLPVLQMKDAQEARNRYSSLAVLTKTEHQIIHLAEAVLAGAKVINMLDVFRQTGKRDGLPQIAIAPTIARTVHYRVDTSDWWMIFRAQTGTQGRLQRPVWWSIRFPDLLNFPVRSATASVPPVPAQFRSDRLSHQFLIWEPTWTNVKQPDPILVEHLFDTFYTVVATWDLTTVELSILSGDPDD